jgi:hypothetical protein
MIQIDMPMPTNCLECPACNEYLACSIPVNGRGWGENDVLELRVERSSSCLHGSDVLCSLECFPAALAGE